MLLIFEGSNRVGKTSMINKIKERRDSQNKITVIINDRIDNDLIGENYKVVSREIGKLTISLAKTLHKANPDILVILDRFHLSEIVYGTICRKYFNSAMIQLDAELSTLPYVKLILLYSDKYEHLSKKDYDIEKLEEYRHKFFLEYKHSAIANKIMLCLDEDLGGENNEISSSTIDYILQ